MKIKCQRLTYRNIDSEAQKFLDGFPEKGSYPIDIESILDIRLGYKILPLAGLENKTETVGYTSLDNKTIYVDSVVYNHPNENRYRYTLAHEAGHIHLHDNIFQQVSSGGVKTIKAYESFRKKIDDDTYGWLEYQAYSFGGAVLIPENYLKSEISTKKKEMKQNGMDLENPSKDTRMYFFNYLAQTFSVSGVCLRKRLKGLKMDIF